MANMEVTDGPGIGLPQRYVRRVWLIVATLLVLGALTSWILRDWICLGRFGALVTVAAMILATFNADIQASLLVQYLNEYMDPSEHIYARIRSKPHLYGIQQSLTEDQATEVLKREVDAFNERTRATLRDEMTSALRKLELWIAIVGTVVWAFADLINKLYPARPT
jgi:hypothetical protein